MNRHLYLVTGYPGSGKTTWCRAQCATLGPTAHHIDDPLRDPLVWRPLPAMIQHVFVSDPLFMLNDPCWVRETVLAKMADLSSFDPQDWVTHWVTLDTDWETSRSRARPHIDKLMERLRTSAWFPPPPYTAHAHCLSYDTAPICDTMMLQSWRSFYERPHSSYRSSAQSHAMERVSEKRLGQKGP